MDTTCLAIRASLMAPKGFFLDAAYSNVASTESGCCHGMCLSSFAPDLYEFVVCLLVIGDRIRS